MTRRENEHSEVFRPSVPMTFENTRTVFPPVADADGKFQLSEVMDWWDLMDQTHSILARGCRFFPSQLIGRPIQDAQRGRRCLLQIEALVPIFRSRRLSLIAEQQRCKDICAMLACE